jgi:tRNA pseudouridine38-40 synthase
MAEQQLYYIARHIIKVQSSRRSAKTLSRYKAMPLYKLVVAYDGTRFNGFQRQTATSALRPETTTRPTKRPYVESSTGKRKPSAVTVQESLEQAVSDWIGCSIPDLRLRFAGRTDKGVHARGQVVALTLPDLAVALANKSQDEKLLEIQKSINSRLPVDISVDHVQVCENLDFEPRHDVKLKQYSYTIKYRRLVQDADGNVLPACRSGPNTVRSALDSPCIWVCPWALDDSKMDALCRHLTGEHDFSAFVHKEDRHQREHTLKLEKMSFTVLTETSEAAPVVTVRLICEAKGFRRSMVRNLVGFCVDVCRGHDGIDGMDLDDLWSGDEAIANKIHSAPASGLCLERVDY